MASILNATTSSGLVTSADNSGSLQLATNNGTTALTIDTSQNVGVGTTSPATKFHVSGQTRIADSSNSANYMTLGVGANAPYGNASLSTTTAGLSIVAEGAGNMTFSNNGSERMRIDSAGAMLVGTTTVYNTATTNVGFVGNVGSGISVNTTTATNGATFEVFLSTGTLIGSISNNNNTGVSYNTTSDYRLKENITPMTGALAKIAQLKPVTYTWKSNGSDGEGFIAHELQAVVPNAVVGEKDAVDADGNIKPQGVDTSFLVATLTAAIQELNAKVDAQAVRIAELEGAR